MDANYLVWFGYIASAVIAWSMTQSSIVKFRWINLIGALSFSLYGFMIHAIPVVLLNGFIVLVDLFYLRRIYLLKELFDVIEISSDSAYLAKFLHFHADEIQAFFPEFTYIPGSYSQSFFVLRNTAVAGIFLATEKNSDLYVQLDYVVPEYRDYKNGKYIYHRLKERFFASGYKQICSYAQSTNYNKYLQKMGFTKNEDDIFVKTMLN